MGEWIKCSSRLPPIKHVLSDPVRIGGVDVPTLYRSGEVVTFDGKRVTAMVMEWFHGQKPLSGITHWQPLPEPPHD